MTNINIARTNNGTWAVKADTERFGKQEIMFESYSRSECVEYASRYGYTEKKLTTADIKKGAISALNKKGFDVDRIKIIKSYEVLGQEVYLINASVYMEEDIDILGYYDSIQNIDFIYYPNTMSIRNADVVL